MKKIFAAVLLVISLVGCGGGGDGAAPATATPVGTTVSLSTMKSVFVGSATGFQFNFPALTGNDSVGRSWSGSYRIHADGPTVIDSLNVTARTSFVTLQLAGGSSASSTSTGYFLSSDSSPYKSISSTGVTYTPTTSIVLPSSAKVGDSGSLGVATGSDGTTSTVTWAVNPGTNGEALFVLSTVINSGSTVTGTEVDTFTLDPSGVPRHVLISVNVNGITVTLSGNRQ